MAPRRSARYTDSASLRARLAEPVSAPHMHRAACPVGPRPARGGARGATLRPAADGDRSRTRRTLPTARRHASASFSVRACSGAWRRTGGGGRERRGRVCGGAAALLAAWAAGGSPRCRHDLSARLSESHMHEETRFRAADERCERAPARRMFGMLGRSLFTRVRLGVSPLDKISSPGCFALAARSKRLETTSEPSSRVNGLPGGTVP